MSRPATLSTALSYGLDAVFRAQLRGSLATARLEREARRAVDGGTAREGDCVCGATVAAHFSKTDRWIPCERLALRLAVTTHAAQSAAPLAPVSSGNLGEGRV